MDFLYEDLENGKYERGWGRNALTLASNHTHEIAPLWNKRRYSEPMRRHHGRYGIFFNRRWSWCGHGPATWQEPLELALSLWRRCPRYPAPS